ncbi:MAG: PQQ-dependent sugar dehydrogenase, partial [Nitrospirales bacterium]|nr:PQQ-dependent sugar dehydrogenase [Nitrospirales bacterium]
MVRRGITTVCCLCLFLLWRQAASGSSDAGDTGAAGDVPTPREWPKVSFTLKAGGVEAPTHISAAGDRSGRLFVTEQRGRVRIIKGGTLLKTPFLDISAKVSCCGERGLLSAAFPPGYAAKKYFYVNYTDRSGDTVIARYRTSSDPDAADPKSEQVLLTIRQPYANHNGGLLAFGPDGYLYIGMGDGGSAGDPHNNGQHPGALLGKMLRIDVESGGLPYGVPGSNPYVNREGYRPEIWAMGVRNPWRFSFDRLTGDLYIADVGQELYEEVDFQPAASRGGENYGWNVMEGMHCFKAKECNRKGLVMPAAEYGHAEGCS